MHGARERTNRGRRTAAAPLRPNARHDVVRLSQELIETLAGEPPREDVEYGGGRQRRVVANDAVPANTPVTRGAEVLICRAAGNEVLDQALIDRAPGHCRQVLQFANRLSVWPEDESILIVVQELGQWRAVVRRAKRDQVANPSLMEVRPIAIALDGAVWIETSPWRAGLLSNQRASHQTAGAVADDIRLRRRNS